MSIFSSFDEAVHLLDEHFAAPAFTLKSLDDPSATCKYISNLQQSAFRIVELGKPPRAPATDPLSYSVAASHPRDTKTTPANWISVFSR
ncbi:hypothetical protein NEUTE2DRAFT_56592 [Neurospora tetrasperma FGSC 2509]|nr:hypothetical protein NEUTE2DRAFT_56592 [Neurospora tetrasperma FGSC 2509]